MIKIDRHGKKINKMIFRADVRIRYEMRHFKFFVKWIILGVVIGVVGGLAGTAFHIALEYAGDFAKEHTWTLYLLPAAGLVIVFSYRLLRIYNDEGTNSILRAARAEDTAAFRVTPLIFLASFLTHFCGGSAGREGAALQIGGSLGSFIGRKLKLNKYDHQLMVMCGMSAVFCALFATPLTAAFFSIEVAGVGTVFYAGLVPAVTASLIAMMISKAFGVKSLEFVVAGAASPDIELVGKIVLLAILTAYLSILFCILMHNVRHLYGKYIQSPYLRILVGAALVIAVTLLSGCRDYNGAGMDVISRALSGEAKPEAFLLKMVLTALTLGAGYKGGEIVPVLFIGSTFGCAVGGLLGLDPLLAAEIGMIGMFCGAVNCPISSILLSVEFFGSSNFLLFGIAAAICYLLSGYYSLYSGQKFMNSKIIPIPFEKPAE